MSDGECNEGSVWEAAMLAPAQQLGNLMVMVDFNKWQATGRSCEVLALEPLQAKFEAFGWRSFEVNGHDIAALTTLMRDFRTGQHDRPTALIAHTRKGKGVSFMEDDNNWHYRVPKIADLTRARQELELAP
jgi:transketolase